MSKQPSVTVLMSVYNDTEFLSDSIRSVLDQTFTDFEFLILDDGSTDRTSTLLASFNDHRVRVIRNEINLGLTYSLRRGAQLARGRYLARLDSDDLALPNRLERQVAFLEEHAEVSLLGSACRLIDTNGKLLEYLGRPETDLEIRWFSCFANPFLHSSILVRRDDLLEYNLNYDEAFLTAQDYDLWTRILKYKRGANLADPLIYYRVRHGITQSKKQEQLSNTSIIALRMVQQELPEFTITAEQFHRLWTLYYVNHGLFLGERGQWAAVAGLHRKFYKCFATKYERDARLKKITREQGIATMRSILRSAFPPGWARMFAELVGDDPWLPVAFSLHLGKAGAKLGRKLLLNKGLAFSRWNALPLAT